MPEDGEKQPIWSLSGEELIRMLRQVEKGDSPEIVYAEAYANSQVNKYQEEDTD